MRKQAYTIIGALLFISSFAFSTARAQSTNQLVANIPFEFSAGNQKLPAGKYTVTVTNPASDQKVVQIRSLDGGKGTMLQVYPVKGQTRDGARLVFHCYGDRYFLAQAWTAADEIGMEAPKSRAERAVWREKAGQPRKSETVALSTHR